MGNRGATLWWTIGQYCLSSGDPYQVPLTLWSCSFSSPFIGPLFLSGRARYPVISGWFSLSQDGADGIGATCDAFAALVRKHGLSALPSRWPPVEWCAVRMCSYRHPQCASVTNQCVSLRHFELARPRRWRQTPPGGYSEARRWPLFLVLLSPFGVNSYVYSWIWLNLLFF